jgi:hypothetical protein
MCENLRGTTLEVLEAAELFLKERKSALVKGSSELTREKTGTRIALLRA